MQEVYTMKEINEILENVYLSVLENGKDPILLIAAYITGGEEKYITRKRDARDLITSVSRKDIVLSLLTEYLDNLRTVPAENYEKNKTAVLLSSIIRKEDSSAQLIDRLSDYLISGQTAYVTAAAHAGKEALSLNSMDIVSELVRWHFEKTL